MPEMIVIERKPRWTPELQRCIASLQVGTDEPFSVTPCANGMGMHLQQIAPGTIVVLDVNFGVAECLHFLGKMLPHLTECTVIAIGTPATQSLEWIFYEMGVTVYLADCHHGEALMSICRRLQVRRS